MKRSVVAGSLVLAFAAACDRRDDALARRVQAELRTTAIPEPIEVSANRGVVVLRGQVLSASEKEAAERAARAVPGVRAVDDRLGVARPPSLTAADPDAEEAAAISSALGAAGLHGLHVDVRDGTVRLTGVLPLARHDDAIRAVLSAAPNARIDDRTTTP